MAALAIAPSPLSGESLWDLQQDLAALIESTETVLPGQEAEFLEDLRAVLMARGQKIDNIHWTLCHWEKQLELGKEERVRLLESNHHYERMIERLKDYIVRIIKMQPPDKKGRYPELEGNSIRLKAWGSPSKVNVTDESQIPPTCKTVEVKMPADLWLELVSEHPELETRANTPMYEVSLSATKKALEAGEQIAGADLLINQHSLRRL